MSPACAKSTTTLSSIWCFHSHVFLISFVSVSCTNCDLKRTEARPTALEALHHPWLEAAAATEQQGDIAQSAMEQGGSSSSEVQSESKGLAGRLASGSSGSTSYDDSLVQRLQQFGTYNR